MPEMLVKSWFIPFIDNNSLNQRGLLTNAEEGGESLKIAPLIVSFSFCSELIPFASINIAFLTLALLRSAPLRSALLRSAPIRLAQLRLIFMNFLVIRCMKLGVLVVIIQVKYEPVGEANRLYGF